MAPGQKYNAATRQYPTPARGRHGTRLTDGADGGTPVSRLPDPLWDPRAAVTSVPYKAHRPPGMPESGRTPRGPVKAGGVEVEVLSLGQGLLCLPTAFMM